MVKSKKYIVIVCLLIFSVLFASCSLPGYADTEFFDVQYKDNLTLDIFLPLERMYSKNPVVIYFHGGGWVSGDKSEISDMFPLVLNSLRENGIAVISADYSLLTESKNKNYADCISDAVDCVQWVLANAKKYDFDAENICVMGYSAGAYLALMTSYGDINETVKGKIKLCADISGPVVFYDEYDEYGAAYTSDSLSVYSKYLFDETAASYYEDLYDAAVLNSISKDDSHTSLLIYACGDDDVVPSLHSEELYITAEAAQIDVQYISFAQRNHFFEPTGQIYSTTYTFSDICEKISKDIIGILKK